MQRGDGCCASNCCRLGTEGASRFVLVLIAPLPHRLAHEKDLVLHALTSLTEGQVESQSQAFVDVQGAIFLCNQQGSDFTARTHGREPLQPSGGGLHGVNQFRSRQARNRKRARCNWTYKLVVLKRRV